MKTVVLTRNENTARQLEKKIQLIYAPESVVGITEFGNILHYFEQYTADVVFLDLDDGQTDWQDICAKVKYANRKMWLVLLSNDPFRAVKAFEAGASDFLFKPVGQDQLERTIKKWKNTVTTNGERTEEIIR